MGGGIIGTTEIATTAEAAAKLLGIPRDELNAWARDPSFPGKTSSRGKAGRYPISEIRAWRDRQEEIVRTAAEAAIALGVSRKTFDQWAKRPGFPGEPAGRGRPGRYPIAEIRAWRTMFVAQPTNIVTGDETYQQRMAAARLSQEETKATGELVKLQAELGKLISFDDNRSAIERVIATTKAILDEIEDRIEPRLPANLAPKLKEAIRQAVKDARVKAYSQIEEALAADSDDEEEGDA